MPFTDDYIAPVESEGLLLTCRSGRVYMNQYAIDVPFVVQLLDFVNGSLE